MAQKMSKYDFTCIVVNQYRFINNQYKNQQLQKWFDSMAMRTSSFSDTTSMLNDLSTYVRVGTTLHFSWEEDPLDSREECHTPVVPQWWTIGDSTPMNCASWFDQSTDHHWLLHHSFWLQDGTLFEVVVLEFWGYGHFMDEAQLKVVLQSASHWYQMA